MSNQQDMDVSCGDFENITMKSEEVTEANSVATTECTTDFDEEPQLRQRIGLIGTELAVVDTSEEEVVTRFERTTLLESSWRLENVAKLIGDLESSILGTVCGVQVKLAASWTSVNNNFTVTPIKCGDAPDSNLKDVTFELKCEIGGEKFFFATAADENQTGSLELGTRKNLTRQLRESGQDFVIVNLLAYKSGVSATDGVASNEDASIYHKIKSSLFGIGRNVHYYVDKAKPYYTKLGDYYEKLKTVMELGERLTGAQQNYVKSVVLIGLSSMIMSGMKDVERLKEDNALLRSNLESTTNEVFKIMKSFRYSQKKLFSKVEHLERELGYSVRKLKKDINELVDENEDSGEVIAAQLNYELNQRMRELEDKIGSAANSRQTNEGNSREKFDQTKEMYKKLNQATIERQQLKAKVEQLEQNARQSSAYLQNLFEKLKLFQKYACNALPSWASSSLCSDQGLKFDSVPKFVGAA